jgi:hypothetical protein
VDGNLTRPLLIYSDKAVESENEMQLPSNLVGVIQQAVYEHSYLTTSALLEENPDFKGRSTRYDGPPTITPDSLRCYFVIALIPPEAGNVSEEEAQQKYPHKVIRISVDAKNYQVSITAD